jgi:hypothetical protein
MNSKKLVITVHDENKYYGLYADGVYGEKRYVKSTGTTKLFYNENAVIFLYYTYPAYRQVCAVRNTENGGIFLPSLSKKVFLLFNLSASRVDSVKRAVNFLNKTYGSAYNFSDDFYIRLYFLLLDKSKVYDSDIKRLAELSGFPRCQAVPETGDSIDTFKKSKKPTL